MLTPIQIENKLIEVKPILQQKYFVSKIGYFGSFSTNTANENSDIDILVELQRPLGWEFFDLQFYLQSLFNKKVDLVTLESLKTQLKNKILIQVKYV